MPHLNRCLGPILGTAVIVIVPAVAGAQSSGGGTAAPERANVQSVRCVTEQQWACPAGSPVVVKGDGLEAVSKVVFLGRAGKRDDRTSKRPKHDGDEELTVTVPAGAKTGPLRLVTPGAGTAKTRRSLRVLKAAPRPAAPQNDVEVPPPGARDLVAGEALFAGSQSVLRFAYDIPAPGVVEVVNTTSGAVVRRFDVAAGAGSVTWDGTVAGMPVAAGGYQLRLAGSPPTAQAAQASPPVEVRDAIFPIRGPHDQGQTATNDFGGARGHGGQDMFAKCGTPLVAVRPAVVQFAATQARAGNYVVLQDASGQSYAYMHMRDPSLVKKGQKVFAGQQVGLVGETGRASGCHLHFELWTAPGWYEGGKAIDPLPELKRWDDFS